MFSRRGTLAVVCLATAMLMLDIAVVNTALPKIASSLDAGISGLQWVVDAYTVALAAVVLTSGSIADRFGRRRLFVIGLVALHRRVALVRRGRQHRDARRRPRGAGPRRGDPVRHVARAARGRLPRTGRSASKALAIYGATIGASFAVGPAVGGALTSYLGWRWVFYVNVPVGIATLAATYRWVRESRDPKPAASTGPARSALVAGLFLLVLGAAARERGRAGAAPAIVAELAGAAAPARGLPRRSRPASRSRCSRSASSGTGSSPARRSRCSRSRPRSSRSSSTRRCTCSRSSASRRSRPGLVYLPGTMLIFVVSGASAQLLEKVSAGRDDRVRARARRGRPGARSAGDGDVVVVDCCCPR